jgi:serine/threonine protein kinase/lipopolysaccharide biosynthesis regulator YciM
MGKKDDTIQCSNCLSDNTRDSLFCNKCGTRLEEDQGTLAYSEEQQQQMDRFGFSPGENFGKRYRVIEEIGRGGMGIVYKAEDKELSIKVALKMIRPAQSQNPRFIERFRKETRLARSISHENIIRIYDLGEIDEIKYISMEYIKGQSLKELINASGSLTIETTTNISKQICDALAAAHRKGIVHQDLKPQNIMIDGDGNVHVMDFGVARLFEEEETGVSRGITGTPPYLSPERAKGEKVDPRSDIYSFGIIMFEMLTGERPFNAETMEGYIHKHLYIKPPTPSKKNPRIPALLDKIILKCLEKDKEKRYLNVQDILKDLEDVAISTPVPPKIWTNKSRMFFIAAFLILIIGIGYIIFKGTKEEEAITPLPEDGRISVAVMYFENNTGDQKLDHWRFGLQDWLMTDLTQSKYLRVLPDDQLHHILQKMDQLETKQYSSGVLDTIASEEDIQYFILGSFGKAGDNYRLTFKIKESFAREFMDTEIKEGKANEFHSLIDQATLWAKDKVLAASQVDDDIDKEIGKISTSSPEALMYYREGINYYRQKKFKESIQSLEKAVGIDPEFAMAYKKIANNYYRREMSDETEKYLLKARELGDRISDRERYLIEGSYLNLVKKDYDQAINTYQGLLELYPEDEEAYLMIGAIYFNLEEWDTALEYYNKVPRSSDKSYGTACINIAYIFMAKGLYNQARDVLQANKELLSSQVYFIRNLSHTYLYEGRYSLALQEVNKAISLAPDDYNNIALLGNIYHLNGDFSLAEKTYNKLKKADEPLHRGNGSHWMSMLFLLQGKYKKCLDELSEGVVYLQKSKLKEIESASQISLAYTWMRLDRVVEALDAAKHALEVAREIRSPYHQKWALHLQGLAYLKMNKMLDAEKTANQLKKLIEETRNNQHMRHYYHLMGKIDLQKKLVDQSIEKFAEAVSLLSSQAYLLDDQSFFIDSYASALYKNGNIKEAKINYGRISNLTWGRMKYGDIYAKSFYWLGKINQELGSIVEARENYKIFLNLWKDADHSDAELADAQKQYEVLILN